MRRVRNALALVFLPLGVVQLAGSRGERTVVVGPRGPLPIDAQLLSSRATALRSGLRKWGRAEG